MDCSTIEGIGGRILCMIDTQFDNFLYELLTTQTDTFISFGNLISMFFAFFAIGGLVVYTLKIPVIGYGAPE